MAWQLRKVIENKKEEYIMQDKSKVIFNNEIDRKAYRKAINSKKKYARKYGDDSNADYKVTIKKNKYIGDMLGVYDVRVADKPASVSNGNKEEFDTDKGIIVGNIRMGFGHYRISMAIASAANALGYVPYWMDLNSYDNTTCTKVIRAQNDLYSLGSRLSQKSRLFLHNNPQHNTAADIVKIRKSTKSHVSTSLKNLENKGLVERIQSKDNKKHIEIVLLDKAEIILKAGINAQKQFAKDVLSGLTEEEKHMCMKVFDKICNNAEKCLREHKEKANEN